MIKKLRVVRSNEIVIEIKNEDKKITKLALLTSVSLVSYNDLYKSRYLSSNSLNLSFGIL
jgi:hypothetical protein